MKIAVISNRRRLSGWLTRLWTGCYAYHVVFVDVDPAGAVPETGGVMYDMHLIRRRRPWPHYAEADVELYDAPHVTREYLEERLSTDDAVYGVLDYLLFALRPLYHLLGRSTRNARGVICSEMVNNDLWACAFSARFDVDVDAVPNLVPGEWPTPFDPDAAPPSPCDLRRWLAHRVAT